MHSYTDQKGRGSASLAMASMILGIVSVALSMTGLSIFIGALAVILALLSRGSGPMLSQAAAGMITGIVGICLEAGILAASCCSCPQKTLNSTKNSFRRSTRNIRENPQTLPFPPGRSLLWPAVPLPFQSGPVTIFS